jgi:hypothetical protein
MIGSRSERVVVCDYGCGLPAGEKLMVWRATHGHFFTALDDQLNSLDAQNSVPTPNHVAQADALRAHWRAIGECEDMVRSYIQ